MTIIFKWHGKLAGKIIWSWVIWREFYPDHGCSKWCHHDYVSLRGGKYFKILHMYAYIYTLITGKSRALLLTSYGEKYLLYGGLTLTSYGENTIWRLNWCHYPLSMLSSTIFNVSRGFHVMHDFSAIWVGMYVFDRITSQSRWLNYKIITIYINLKTSNMIILFNYMITPVIQRF